MADDQGYTLSEESVKKVAKMSRAFYGNGGNVSGPGFVPSFGGSDDPNTYWVKINGPLAGSCNYSGYVAIPKQGEYDGTSNFDDNFFEFSSPPEACIVVNPADKITNNHSLYGFVPCYHVRTNSDGKKVMLTYAFAFTACNPSTGEPDDEDYVGSED